MTAAGLLLAAALPAAPGTAARSLQESPHPTPAERSDYLAFTRPAALAAFLEELTAVSDEIGVDTLAWTGEAGGRGYPVLAVRLGEARTVGEGAAGRPVVLVLAGQHGDERSGVEAALRLARELAVGELRPLLRELAVVAIPMANPEGAEAGTRTDGAGRDPNRDHALLRSPTARAAHDLFRHHRPHLVLDLHELGPSGYDVQIGLPTHPNVDSALVAFGRFRLLPAVARELADRSLTFREYVVPVAGRDAGRSGEESEGGAAEAGFWTGAPMEASHARNALALRGALAFLLEVSSRRGIEGLEERTDAQYAAARAFLHAVAGQAGDVVSLVEERRRMAEAAPGPVVLEARHAEDTRGAPLVWRVREATGAVVVRRTQRWRPLVRPTLVIPAAAAWVLPPDDKEVAALLARHGFRVERLDAPRRARVGRYPARAAPGGADAEAPAESDAEAPAESAGAAGPGRAGPAEAGPRVEWEERTLPAGSLVVDARQPGAVLLATLLEPWSRDGWYRALENGAATEAEDRYYPIVRLLEPLEGRTHPSAPE